MSGTALDHWLVRAYLRELDAALRGVPAAQARELTEQITAHLEVADQADFNASTNEPEQEYFTSTVSGPQVDSAATQQILAEAMGTSARATPLTAHGSGLTASRWYGDMSTTIGDTRKVAGQLTDQITDRANTLKSDATRSLLLTGIATLVLLLVLLISAVLARPPRKRHADTLEAITR